MDAQTWIHPAQRPFCTSEYMHRNPPFFPQSHESCPAGGHLPYAELASRGGEVLNLDHFLEILVDYSGEKTLCPRLFRKFCICIIAETIFKILNRVKTLDILNKSLRYTLMNKTKNRKARVLRTGVGIKSVV